MSIGFAEKFEKAQGKKAIKMYYEEARNSLDEYGFDEKTKRDFKKVLNKAEKETIKNPESFYNCRKNGDLISPRMLVWWNY